MGVGRLIFYIILVVSRICLFIVVMFKRFDSYDVDERDLRGGWC